VRGRQSELSLAQSRVGAPSGHFLLQGARSRYWFSMLLVYESAALTILRMKLMACAFSVMWLLSEARAFAADPPAVTAWLATVKVSAPPESLKLKPFYTKYVDVLGLPVVGSAKVSDAAIVEAAYLARLMLNDRPEVARAMAENKTRLAVMAVSELTTDIPEHADLKPKAHWDRRARGLGATKSRPAVSCAEENLLMCPGDPYRSENIMIHEFSHAIHQMGMNTVDKTFDRRLAAAHKAAIEKGLWKKTYAATNHSEYWAEGVQSYFRCNRRNDSEHNDVDTREKLQAYDPELFKLVAEVFKNATWEYVPPVKRSDQPHLKDLDRAKLPKFAWPKKEA